MEEIIKNFIVNTFVSFDEMVVKAAEVLADADGSILGQWDAMLAYSQYIKPIAISIAVICILWELLQTAERVDRITPQQGIMVGIKMCLTKVLIDVTPALLRALYLSACGIISALGFSHTSLLGGDVKDLLVDYLNQINGFMPWLGLALVCFIAALGIKFCGLILQVMAYGRMFEIFVFLIASPLPVAFFPTGDGGGGFSRITGRFLREFAAICLQGVMMLLVMAIFDRIVGSSIVSTVLTKGSYTDPSAAVTSILYTVLMGVIALVMAVFSCGRWARSLLDVGG